jgi:hypothetical protein
MVEHIVLLQWTEQASQEAIDNVMAEVNGMKAKIAEIVDISCGANFAGQPKGYTHGLAARFTDAAALEGYLQHPEHQRVVHDLINPIRADMLVFNYQF